MRGENSAPRISYLRGWVEIMSPSRSHESFRSIRSIRCIIGCLVETYCLERGIRFRTLGAWILQSAPDERAAEPDDCWTFGDADADRPDLAIEVEWTWGRIDKLDIYRKLGVAEVWWWREGRLTPHALEGEHYVALDHSRVCPGWISPGSPAFSTNPPPMTQSGPAGRPWGLEYTANGRYPPGRASKAQFCLRRFRPPEAG